MSAFPMIARCMERQWWGFSADEREEITRAWNGDLPMTGILNTVGHAVQPYWPIWQAQHTILGSVILLGVKED